MNSNNYQQRIEEIRNLEKEFLENPKILRGMKIRNRLRDILFYEENIPEIWKISLRKRKNIYSEWVDSEIPNFLMIDYIKNNSLSKIN